MTTPHDSTPPLLHIAAGVATLTLNRPLADQEWFDLAYQVLGIASGLAPVALVLWLVWREQRPRFAAIGLGWETGRRNVRHELTVGLGLADEDVLGDVHVLLRGDLATGAVEREAALEGGADLVVGDLVAELFGEHACESVGGGACRRRNDELDALIGPIGRLRKALRGRQSGCR